MSKEFEKIKGIVTEHRDALRNKLIDQEELKQREIQNEKNKKEQAMLVIQAKIDADKIILKNSGVIELLQEIRDSGLVRDSDKKIRKQVPIYKTNIFGKKYIDRYEERVVSEYTPASVYISENIIKPDNLKASLVFISLTYNTYYETVKTYGDDSFEHHGCEVRIAVINGKLNLVSRKRGDIPENDIYSPIEPGKLAETIAEAIKNPPFKF